MEVGSYDKWIMSAGGSVRLGPFDQIVAEHVASLGGKGDGAVQPALADDPEPGGSLSRSRSPALAPVASLARSPLGSVPTNR